MSEFTPSRLWGLRLLYGVIAGILLFFLLLPLDTAPPRWAGPDFLLAVTLGWSLRRPDAVPLVMVALVWLLADFLLGRPPGLLALLIVLAAQAMHGQANTIRDQTFAAEWLTVAIAIGAVGLAYRLSLMVLVLPRPPLGLHAMQLALTVLAYPLVILLSVLLPGLRKDPGNDLAKAGRRM